MIKYVINKPLATIHIDKYFTKIADEIYFNQEVFIEKELKNSYYIRTDYDYYGYINKKDIFKIDLRNEKTIRETVVNIAKSFLNVRYKLGGKSFLGIDCSGLCSLAYYLCDKIIYRDSEYKDEYTKKIDKDSLKPGDLLYSTGHIMLYIGDNLYIHSSKSRNKVVINSLDKDSPLFRKDISINSYATVFV